VRTAEANILAANAQRKLADITAQAQKPGVDLLELTVNGLNNPPDKDGFVNFTLIWRFSNTGGSAFTAEDVIYGIYTGDALPQVMPDGFRMDGAGIVVINSITSALSPKDPISLKITKEVRDQLIFGNSKMFFFARVDYLDMLKMEHSRCFGREIILKDGNSLLAVPSGGEAYQCDS
jgi:hypothetical protein